MSDIAKRVIWSIILSIPTAVLGVILRGVFQAWGIFDPFSQWLGGWLKMHITPVQIEWTVAACIALLAYVGLLWIVWRYHRSPPPIIMGDQANFHGEVADPNESQKKAPDRVQILNIIEMARKAGWNINAVQSNDVSELTDRLNQAAADGTIKFWGRKYKYDLGEMAATTFPLIEVPPEHFAEFSFQPLNLFMDGQRNFYIFTGKLGRQSSELRGQIYQDIHANRAQLYEWMTRNAPPKKDDPNGESK